MTVTLEQFDTLDALIANKMNQTEVPADFEMPEFPIPTEDINSINDILNLIQFLKDNKLDQICPKYHKLVDCESIIRDFNQMIGLKDPKENIATQILSLCDRVGRQKTSKDNDKDREKSKKRGDGRKRSGKEDVEVPEDTPHVDDNEEPLLNTVIYGPPGCGKTTIANFLAKLYLKFGVLENGKVIKGDRANLIGQWVGETAIKTKKVLNQALGGVLFIDEAYQLGHAADGNRCPFAYECINTITQFITEHKGQITIMLAGYKKDIQENFFAQNEGLDRRFPWKYTLERNKPEELVEIFKLQAKKSGYSVATETKQRNIRNEKGELTKDKNGTPLTEDYEACILKPEFFAREKNMFKYSGGDTQTLFDKCKMVHDKRMFSCIRSDKIIGQIDLDKGFLIYKKIKDEYKDDGPPIGMYN